MSTHLFLQQLQRDISKLVEPFVLKTQNLNIDFLFASHDKLIVSVCTESLNIEKMQDAIIKAHKSHMFAAQSDFKMEKNGGKTLTFLRFIDHLQVSDAKTQTFTIEQFGPVVVDIRFVSEKPVVLSSSDNELTPNDQVDTTINMIDETSISGIVAPNTNHKLVQDGTFRTYNRFISIGSWCIAANYLKNRKWQYRAYPYDWAFSNLNAVIFSVTNPMFTLEELKKHPDDRQSFGDSDVQKTLGFPHQESTNVEENHSAIQRRCRRWKNIVRNVSLNNDLKTKRTVALVHFARPTEKYIKVLSCLKRLLRHLHHYNPQLDFEIISIWHRVWNDNDKSKQQDVNKVYYLGTASTTLSNSTTSNKIHIYLAKVSNEWDGHNWSGRMQNPLLDEIFNQFSYVPMEFEGDKNS